MKPTYIGKVFLENYKCFLGKHELSFLDEQERLFQWTVILGNNNSGKTNLLKAIADLEPVPVIHTSEEDYVPQYFNDGYYRLLLPNGRVNANFGFSDFKEEFITLINDWFYESSSSKGYSLEDVESINMFSYGTNRRTSTKSLSENNTSNSATLFGESDSLININEWLLKLNYSAKNAEGDIQIKAKKRLEKVKNLVVSEIFPEIEDVRFITDEDLNNFIEFKTKDGWYQLQDLGYGYQSTLAWIVDLSKKMFERYPNAENPLKEPAIVLVDEIDLHLHPSWQKRIIQYLSNHFTATQFIVTTHSPMVLQAMERVNLFVLRRNGQGVNIERYPLHSFQGWEVNEIVADLMDTPIHSQTYKALMNDFVAALDEDHYAKAKTAYDALLEILHPESAERKLLSIQLSQLTPTK